MKISSLVAFELTLDDEVRVQKVTLEKNISGGDLIESLIAAIYIDSN